MIKKVAESIALRKAFSQELNGLYTEEEMPVKYAAPKEEFVEVQPELVVKTKEVLNKQTGELVDVVFTDDDLPWEAERK